MTAASAGGAGTPVTVGYLTKRFPRLSETFILDEILGLEAAGVPLRLFAIADPLEATVQPDVARVASPVTYLHPGGQSQALRHYLHFLRCHATLLRRQPLRWLRVVGHIAVARRHRSTVKHFLEAGAMALELERADAGHVHAAFAHGPASIAHFVHLLTDLPFSFAAHAKDLYLSSPDMLARKVAASSFVLVCSSSAAEEMRRIISSHWDPAVAAHTDKVVLAVHGVDTERFRPSEPHPHPHPHDSARPLRILAVGRLVPKKGYPDLLAALSHLRQAGVDVDCQVVGSGDQREALRRRAAELGVEDRVTFAGALPQPDIVAHYAWADVFVQASVVTPDGDRDGIPNSVMEAMASGVPVVATSVAGIPEVVHDGSTGLLVPAGDPVALAGALHALAADPCRRRVLGTQARRYTVERLARAACILPVAERLRASVGAAPPPSAGALRRSTLASRRPSAVSAWTGRP